jgi:hypothetical protein
MTEQEAREAALTIDDLRLIGARSLAPGERWCVYHPDGPIEESASIDFPFPWQSCARRSKSTGTNWLNKDGISAGWPRRNPTNQIRRPIAETADRPGPNVRSDK